MRREILKKNKDIEATGSGARFVGEINYKERRKKVLDAIKNKDAKKAFAEVLREVEEKQSECSHVWVIYNSNMFSKTFEYTCKKCGAGKIE